MLELIQNLPRFTTTNMSRVFKPTFRTVEFLEAIQFSYKSGEDSPVTSKLTAYNKVNLDMVPLKKVFQLQRYHKGKLKVKLWWE